MTKLGSGIVRWGKFQWLGNLLRKWLCIWPLTTGSKMDEMSQHSPVIPKRREVRHWLTSPNLCEGYAPENRADETWRRPFRGGNRGNRSGPEPEWGPTIGDSWGIVHNLHGFQPQLWHSPGAIISGGIIVLKKKKKKKHRSLDKVESHI